MFCFANFGLATLHILRGKLCKNQNDFKKFFPDLVIPERSLGEYFLECLEKFKDKEGIVKINSEKEMNLAEIKEKALKMFKLL